MPSWKSSKLDDQILCLISHFLAENLVWALIKNNPETNTYPAYYPCRLHIANYITSHYVYNVCVRNYVDL